MGDEEAMGRAIELARETMERGNGPYGSVIVRDGQILAEGANGVNTELDPTAHAETVAIRNACRAVGGLDLSGCTLYTSCEPCWICSTAIRQTRIPRVVIAARGGATGGYTSAYPILSATDVPQFGPPPEVVMGLLADRSEALLVAAGARNPPRG